jgi:hypothetical protein
MTNVILDALSFISRHVPDPEKQAQIKWSVRFVGEDKARIGTIDEVGKNTYMLRNDEVDIFFAADKVLFLAPRNVV